MAHKIYIFCPVEINQIIKAKSVNFVCQMVLKVFSYKKQTLEPWLEKFNLMTILANAQGKLDRTGIFSRWSHIRVSFVWFCQLDREKLTLAWNTTVYKSPKQTFSNSKSPFTQIWTDQFSCIVYNIFEKRVEHHYINDLFREEFKMFKKFRC